MLRYARKIGRPVVHEMVRAVSRDRVIGDNVANAGTVGTFLHARGYEVTFAYWNRDDDAPELAMSRYTEALDALAGIGGNAYLSIKAPAFGYDVPLLEGLLGRSRELGVPLHFDAQGLQTADRTFSLITDVIGAPLDGVGCTLPGRWQRSPGDAERMADLGLSIRVVKGEWPDPDAPRLDPATGFMDVVARLAGRARRVRVATHDPDLARRSIEMLRAAGTPCDLEFLYGFPVRRLLPLPRDLAVPIRVYVPFGHGWIPYCVGYVRNRPAFLWWLARDSLAGRYRNGFPVRPSAVE